MTFNKNKSVIFFFWFRIECLETNTLRTDKCTQPWISSSGKGQRKEKKSQNTKAAPTTLSTPRMNGQRQRGKRAMNWKKSMLWMPHIIPARVENLRWTDLHKFSEVGARNLQDKDQSRSRLKRNIMVQKSFEYQPQACGHLEAPVNGLMLCLPLLIVLSVHVQHHQVYTACMIDHTGQISRRFSLLAQPRGLKETEACLLHKVEHSHILGVGVGGGTEPDLVFFAVSLVCPHVCKTVTKTMLLRGKGGAGKLF